MNNSGAQLRSLSFAPRVAVKIMTLPRMPSAVQSAPASAIAIRYRMAQISWLRSLIVAATCLFSWHAGAQTYPDRPIRFIVPYTPGGLPDVVARLIAQRVSESLDQSVTIDNKPGAFGSVAAGSLLSAQADGYTFMLTDTAMLTLGPLLPRALPFDVKRDFAPVSLIGSSPLYMVINPRVPANNLAEFVAYVKAKPGGVNFGSSGLGSIHHLAAEAVSSAMNIPMTHVPYKGSASSVAAVIGGQVDLVFTAHSNIAGFLKSGQLKALAISSAKRSPVTPDIPALSESIPGYNYSVTLALFARTGTPDRPVARVSSELFAIIKRPDIATQLAKLGVTPLGGDATELSHEVKAESSRMLELFKTVRIKVD